MLRTGTTFPYAAFGPRIFRPIQLTPTITGPDGEEYRLHFETAPDIFGLLVLAGYASSPCFSIAILAAAVVSALLSRYVSSPIVRLQKASRSLAAGALDTRVGAPFTRRRDEVGTLARDFDAMAERISRAGHGERNVVARRVA